MTAEQKLNRVRRGWQEFRRLEDKIEELEALATKITPVLSDMPKGGNKLKDDTWAALADYRDACEYSVRKYIKDCIDLEEELNCIENSKIRTAMKYRYIDRLSTEAIADKMTYDWRTVMRFLDKGKRIYCAVYGDDND